MGAFVDHYIILGLPTGVEGFKVSNEEIRKAYRRKALALHPDKRPGYPNAVSDFQQLLASYTILKDEKAREAFHTDLKIQVQKQKSQQDSPLGRKMPNPPKEKEEEKPSNFHPNSHFYKHGRPMPDPPKEKEEEKPSNFHPNSHFYKHGRRMPDPPKEKEEEKPSKFHPNSHFYKHGRPMPDPPKEKEEEKPSNFHPDSHFYKHGRPMPDPPKEKEEEKPSYSKFHPNSHSQPNTHSHSQPNSRSHSHTQSHSYDDSQGYCESHSNHDSQSYHESHWSHDSHSYRESHSNSDSHFFAYSNSRGNFHSYSGSKSYSHVFSSSNGVKWATHRRKAGMPFGDSNPWPDHYSCSNYHYETFSYQETWPKPSPNHACDVRILFFVLALGLFLILHFLPPLNGIYKWTHGFARSTASMPGNIDDTRIHEAQSLYKSSYVSSSKSSYFPSFFLFFLVLLLSLVGNTDDPKI